MANSMGNSTIGKNQLASDIFEIRVFDYHAPFKSIKNVVINFISAQVLHHRLDKK